MNFVPKERSRKTIERLLAERQRESDERLAEKRRKYNMDKCSNCRISIFILTDNKTFYT